MSSAAWLWGALRRRQLRALLIDDWLPDPRLGAGAPRALALMRAVMAAGWRLTLLPTATDPQDTIDIRRLLPDGDVAMGYSRVGIGRLLEERRSQFDVIIISRPHNMAAFREAVAARPNDVGSTPVIYDAEALFAEREALRSEVMGTPLPSGAAELERKHEIALAEKTRTVVTVNRKTAEAFKSTGHADVRILGYTVEQQPTATCFDERDGFLFVGPTFEDDTPNSDSITWFTDQALPAIQLAMGRPVPLVLAGVQTSGRVAARLSGSVRSLGALSDLTAAYSAARVFVAPTRFAAGIPIKVYDAAARGVPVVMTPLLAEQIDWRHEREVLVAGSPQEFVTQCQRLHNDRDLWKHIRAQALNRVKQDCDPQRFSRNVADLLTDVSGRWRRIF